MKLPAKIRNVFARHGRSGGLKNSPKKLAACLLNLKYARSKRWADAEAEQADMREAITRATARRNMLPHGGKNGRRHEGLKK